MDNRGLRLTGRKLSGIRLTGLRLTGFRLPFRDIFESIVNQYIILNDLFSYRSGIKSLHMSSVNSQQSKHYKEVNICKLIVCYAN